jgi:hypothetical protein
MRSDREETLEAEIAGWTVSACKNCGMYGANASDRRHSTSAPS